MMLIAGMTGKPFPALGSPVDAQAAAVRARLIVMGFERDLGFELVDREFEKLGHRAYHMRRPFHREPDFGVTSVNCDLAELLVRAEPPQ